MTVGAVVLAPGAGSGSDHATLVAVADALDPLPVRRMDFPYRLEGRPFPDRPPRLLDALEREIDRWCDWCDVDPAAVVLGGRSMGGRMCSMLVADGFECAGLVLISYPLHPPTRPDQLRTDHFPQVSVPCLFVSGDRDEFGSPSELEAATATIGGPVEHVWLDGGRHDLRRHDPEIVAAVCGFVDRLDPEARRTR